MANQKGKNKRNYKHGLSYHPLYMAFTVAYQRCTNPNNPKYKTYKGRWGKNTVVELTKYYLKEYERFVKKYPHLTPSIDRINEDGKYEIGNIRICDRVENCKKYMKIKGCYLKGKFGKDHPTSKAVEGYIDGRWRQFGSAHEAEREKGISSSRIGAVCRGKPDKRGCVRKTAGKDSKGNGIRWRFITT